MAQNTLVVAPPRRRWPRRLLIALNIFVAVCLVATAGAYGYFKFRLGQIGKVPFVGGVLRDDDPGRPMNVLLVGSDSRKNISAAERKAFGTQKQVGGERADTMLVLHVDPRQQKAAMLSIPRDLWVTIAGTGKKAKINSAFEGGPQRLVQTITDNLGIEINHYAQVDFNGFRGIVDALGGVDYYFPAPVRDSFTGLHITRAGCVHLDGNMALQLVRSRHYQQYESGRWREDPRQDLGRIDRQQDFIRRVLRKASRAARNPLTLNALIDKAVNNLTIDNRFSTKDMRRLAARFRSLEPDKVDLLDLPITEGRAAGQAVLFLKQPDAQQIIDRLMGRQAPPDTGAPPPPVPPGAVRVRVLNGSGVDGQATEVSAALVKANFKVAGIGSAENFDYERTVIRYAPGQQDEAQLLAAYVQGGAELREDRSLTGVPLVLVTGARFAGIRAPAAAGATTTQAPPATTATTAKGKAKPDAQGPPC